ncbi:MULTISPECIES: hypothetical protein [unclassified Serratia (in: enterobacteria)]|uniref:hypothetical protein n=1 Tax=unclassified Serratia (in: enterobacteria) TaxID=2647522 RepID=UPI003B42B0F9
MKKVIIAALAVALLAPMASFAKGGHYVGGKGGSSHKGSKYVNQSTGNHYIKHK